MQLVTHAWLAMRINPLPAGVRPQPPTGVGVPAVQKKPAKGAKGTTPQKSNETTLGAPAPSPSLSTAEDGGGVTYEEWLELLLRCAQARYREVMCGAEPSARMTEEQVHTLCMGCTACALDAHWMRTACALHAPCMAVLHGCAACACTPHCPCTLRAACRGVTRAAAGHRRRRGRSAAAGLYRPLPPPRHRDRVSAAAGRGSPGARAAEAT